MSSKQNNADRFSGFADIYENARPKVPRYPVDVICRYLGGAPRLVVDLGCGTGLSSEVWRGVSERIIGIEPSDDMRGIAGKKSNASMSFIKAFSDSTGLEAEKAYERIYGRVKEIEAEVPEVRDSFIRYPKDKHLENIIASGYFTYARELLFSNSETCTRERFRNIVLSQGSTQTILKKCPELIEKELAEFHAEIDACFDSEPFEIEFCYRMRVGIK